MKILFLQDDFPPSGLGGSATVAYALAQALHKEGHELFVVTAVQNKKEAGEFELEGLKVFRIYAAYHERWRAYLSLYNPQTVGKVKKILDSVKPEVVHAHNIHRYLSYRCLKLAKRAGAKVFLTAHDAMLFHYGKLDQPVSAWRQLRKFKKQYNPLRNIIIKWYLRYVDKVFAVSNALKEALEHNSIKNVEVLHNGIDTTAWELLIDEVKKFKAKLQLADKKIILFGGRLSTAKGGEQAVRTLSAVLKQVPEATLLVMGRQDVYARHMLELARSLGVEKNIVFTGWILGDELKAAYHASDVVCTLSLYLDPFPTINLEAMACRKPVVGTCFGGTREAVLDGETGYIVDPFDVPLVAQRVADLLQDDAKAARFGAAGYVRACGMFNLKIKAVEHLAKYRI